MRLPRVSGAACLAALLAAATTAAQTFPSRPIRLVVPFPPGTASDFLGRTHFFVFAAPAAGTPKGLVRKLATDIGSVVRDPQTKQRFLTRGADPIEGSSPGAFMKLLRSENVRFAKLIKEANIQPQ